MLSIKLITRCFFIAACLTLPSAMAAGIDCSKASSPAEIVICSKPELIQLDQQLSSTYAKLTHAQPANNAAQQASQQKWLQSRDKCASEGCLRDSYALRIAELGAALRAMRAYKPDNIDMLALNELRQALEKRMNVDKEFPLETVLKSYEITTGLTEFTNTKDGNEVGDMTAHFPSSRPKGVTSDEWQALVNSGIEAGGENGSSSYTLLDMDNDGKRDLIVDSYMGGTGLFNYVSALPRKTNKFVGSYSSLQKEDATLYAAGDDFLYSLNGRGSNQSAYWLRLQGRVYVAYVSGTYGVDNISLLRPLHVNESMPSLKLHYQYTLSIPKDQPTYSGGDRVFMRTLDDQTHAALNTALKLANPTVAQDNVASSPICPLPQNISDDERAGYYGFGTGHYSYEIVGEFPVWFGKTCHIGRLIDWFGAYHKGGSINAQLWIKLPNSGDAEEKQYVVTGKRKAIKIDSGLAKIDLGAN